MSDRQYFAHVWCHSDGSTTGRHGLFYGTPDEFYDYLRAEAPTLNDGAKVQTYALPSPDFDGDWAVQTPLED